MRNDEKIQWENYTTWSSRLWLHLFTRRIHKSRQKSSSTIWCPYIFNQIHNPHSVKLRAQDSKKQRILMAYIRVPESYYTYDFSLSQCNYPFIDIVACSVIYIWWFIYCRVHVGFSLQTCCDVNFRFCLSHFVLITCPFESVGIVFQNDPLSLLAKECWE